MNSCAPGRQFGLSFSCFSISEWMLIKNLLSNKELRKCKHDEICIFKTLSKKKLVSPQSKRLIFKPNYKHHGIPLDTLDINNVLIPYSQVFKNYTHLGTYPSDIYDLIDLKEMLSNKLKNKTKFSIVFNLDENSEPGSHWVAVFIDTSKNIIEYFDSLAKKPIKNINTNLKIIKQSFSEHYGKPFKIYYNDIIHQKDGSECGVYVVYYIIARLFNYSINDINNNIKDDQAISEFRKYIFNLK